MVKIPPVDKAKLVCLASKVGGGVGEAVAVVDCVVRVWWHVVVVLLVVAMQVVQVVLVVGRGWLGGEAGIRRRRLVHRQPRAWIFAWKQDTVSSHAHQCSGSGSTGFMFLGLPDPD
jgi:hypothetical protein